MNFSKFFIDSLFQKANWLLIETCFNAEPHVIEPHKQGYRSTLSATNF